MPTPTIVEYLSESADMLNVNLMIVMLSLGGACVYVSAMSALGRWLATCRETTTVAYVAPMPRGGLGI